MRTKQPKTPKKISQPNRQWIVPMMITLRGYALVDAVSAAEAEVKVQKGEFEFDDAVAEMTDWETRGEPKLNE